MQDKSKEKSSRINDLIFIICISVICFVGISFLNCNFMIPGSINRSNVLGGLKNAPVLDCKESEKRGYDTLVSLLTTIIALKTRME